MQANGAPLPHGRNGAVTDALMNRQRIRPSQQARETVVIEF